MSPLDRLRARACRASQACCTDSSLMVNDFTAQDGNTLVADGQERSGRVGIDLPGTNQIEQGTIYFFNQGTNGSHFRTPVARFKIRG
jgi:hypothetical protein